MPTAWEIFKEVHNLTVEKFGFESHAFTLMINHYHWLNLTPHENVDEGLRYFQTESSKRLSKAGGRINRIYGGRYGWSVIPTEQFYLRTYRYIYMNPVRANLVLSPADYEWSTFTRNGWNLTTSPLIQTEVPKSIADQAAWMLSLREEDDERRVRAALRRRVFEWPRDPSGFK